MSNQLSLADYQSLASRTLISNPPRIYTDQEIMLVWCALGLAGEAAEVFTAAYRKTDVLVKELGDLCWYIAAICTTMQFNIKNIDISINNPRECKLDDLFDNLVSYTGDIAEYVKKTVFHGHEFDITTLTMQLALIWNTVKEICDKSYISIDDVLNTNIEKLKERYPHGFTSIDSIRRIDVTMELN